MTHTVSIIHLKLASAESQYTGFEKTISCMIRFNSQVTELVMHLHAMRTFALVNGGTIN